MGACSPGCICGSSSGCWPGPVLPGGRSAPAGGLGGVRSAAACLAALKRLGYCQVVGQDIFGDPAGHRGPGRGGLEIGDWRLGASNWLYLRIRGWAGIHPGKAGVPGGWGQWLLEDSVGGLFRRCSRWDRTGQPVESRICVRWRPGQVIRRPAGLENLGALGMHVVQQGRRACPGRRSGGHAAPRSATPAVSTAALDSPSSRRCLS